MKFHEQGRVLLLALGLCASPTGVCSFTSATTTSGRITAPEIAVAVHQASHKGGHGDSDDNNSKDWSALPDSVLPPNRSPESNVPYFAMVSNMTEELDRPETTMMANAAYAAAEETSVEQQLAAVVQSQEWQTGVASRGFAAAWQATTGGKFRIKSQLEESDIVIPQSTPTTTTTGTSTTTTSLPTPNGVEQADGQTHTPTNGDVHGNAPNDNEEAGLHRVPKPPSTPPPPPESTASQPKGSQEEIETLDPDGSSPTNYAAIWQAVYASKQQNENKNYDDQNNDPNNSNSNTDMDDADYVDDEQWVEASYESTESLDALDELKKDNSQRRNIDNYNDTLLDELLNGETIDPRNMGFAQAWEMTMGTTIYNQETPSVPQPDQLSAPTSDYADARQATMGSSLFTDSPASNDDIVGDPAAFAKSVAAELDDAAKSTNNRPTGDVSSFQGRPISRKPGKYMNRDRFFFSNPETLKEKFTASKRGQFDELIDKAKNVATTAAIGVGVPISLYVLSAFIADKPADMMRDPSSAAPAMPQQNQVVDLDQDVIPNSKSLDANTQSPPAQSVKPATILDSPTEDPQVISSVMESSASPAVVVPPKSVRPPAKSLKEVLGEGWNGQLQYSRPGGSGAAGAATKKASTEQATSTVAPSNPVEQQSTTARPALSEPFATPALPIPMDADLNIPYSIESQPQTQATQPQVQDQASGVTPAPNLPEASVEQAVKEMDTPGISSVATAENLSPDAASMGLAAVPDPNPVVKGVPGLYGPPSQAADNILVPPPQDMAAATAPDEVLFQTDERLSSLSTNSAPADDLPPDINQPTRDASAQFLPVAVETPVASIEPQQPASPETSIAETDASPTNGIGVLELYAPPSPSEDKPTKAGADQSVGEDLNGAGAPDALVARLDANLDTAPAPDVLLDLVRRASRPVPVAFATQAYLNQLKTDGGTPATSSVPDQGVSLVANAPPAVVGRLGIPVPPSATIATDASKETPVLLEQGAEPKSSQTDNGLFGLAAETDTTADVGVLPSDATPARTESVDAPAGAIQDAAASNIETPDISLTAPTPPATSNNKGAALINPTPSMDTQALPRNAEVSATFSTQRNAPGAVGIGDASKMTAGTNQSPQDTPNSSPASAVTSPATFGVSGGAASQNSLLRWVETSNKPWTSPSYESRSVLSGGLTDKLNSFQILQPASKQSFPAERGLSLDGIRRTMKSAQENVETVQQGVKSLHLGEKFEAAKGSLSSMQEKISSFQPRPGLLSMQERVLSIGIERPNAAFKEPSASSASTVAATKVEEPPVSPKMATEAPSPSSVPASATGTTDVADVSEPQKNEGTLVQQGPSLTIPSVPGMESVAPSQKAEAALTESAIAPSSPLVVQPRAPSFTEGLREEMELAQRGIRSVKETATAVASGAQATFESVRGGIESAKQTATSVGVGAQSTFESLRGEIEAVKENVNKVSVGAQATLDNVRGGVISTKGQMESLAESVRSRVESTRGAIQSAASTIPSVSLPLPSKLAQKATFAPVVDAAPVPLIENQAPIQPEPELPTADTLVPASDKFLPEVPEGTETGTEVAGKRKGGSARAMMRSFSVPWPRKSISDSALETAIAEDSIAESTQPSPLVDDANADGVVNALEPKEAPEQPTPPTTSTPQKRSSLSLYPKRSGPKSLLSDEQLEKLKALEEKLQTVQFSSDPVTLFSDISPTERYFTQMGDRSQNPEASVDRTPVAYWTSFNGADKETGRSQEPQRQPGWFFEETIPDQAHPDWGTLMSARTDQPVVEPIVDTQQQIFSQREHQNQQQREHHQQPPPPRQLRARRMLAPDNYFPNDSLRNRY